MPHANRSTLRQRLRRMVATFLTTEVRGTRSAWLKPTYEGLEDRSLLAVATWTGAVSNDWQSPLNWSNGYLPSQDDTVVLANSNRKNIINVTGAVSKMEFNSVGYVLNGLPDQSLLVSRIDFNQSANVQVKTFLQSTTAEPNSRLIIQANRQAQFGELHVGSTVSVGGFGMFRMVVDSLNINESLSIVQTDGVSTQGFLDITGSLSGDGGALVSQGNVALSIADGTGFDGDILTNGGEVTVSGNLSDS
ncbi:MAG: hypothetical protein ACKO3V_08210, partial [Pirellula sp.]